MSSPTRPSVRPLGHAGTGTTTGRSGHATGSAAVIEGRVLDPDEYAPDDLVEFDDPTVDLPTPVGDRSTGQLGPRATVRRPEIVPQGAGAYGVLAHDREPVTAWLFPGSPRAVVTRVIGAGILAALVAVLGLSAGVILGSPGARILGGGLILMAGPFLAWGSSRLFATPRRLYLAEVDPKGNVIGWSESGQSWDASRLAFASAVAVVVGFVVGSWPGTAPVTTGLMLTAWVLAVARLTLVTSAAWGRYVAREDEGVDLEVLDDPGAEIRVTWHLNVARRPEDPNYGQPVKMAGALLSTVKLLDDGGFSAEVKLPPGNVDHGVLEDHKTAIARAYEVTPSLVHVDKYVAGRAKAGHANLLVLRSDPLHTPRPWRGRSLNKRGQFTVGMYADGSPVRFHLWKGEQGVVHGQAVGGTGAGKSGPLGVALAEAGVSARFFTILLSPKGRRGVPGFGEPGRVDHVALSEEGILLTLEAVEAVMQARIDNDLGGVEPTRTGLPGILVVFDEAPDILGTKSSEQKVKAATETAKRRVSRIVKMGRDSLVALYASAQQPLADELGGSAVRAQLSNAFGGRIDDRGGSQAAQGPFGGLDLMALADEPVGVGYFRGLHLPRRDVRGRAHWMDEESFRIYDRERAHNGPTALDPISQAAWDAVMGTTEEDS